LAYRALWGARSMGLAAALRLSARVVRPRPILLCTRHLSSVSGNAATSGRRNSSRPPLAPGLVLPVRHKELLDGGDASGKLTFGIAAMQGWRDDMEDAHFALPDFDTSKGVALFGVFDGHGGPGVAQLVAERFPAMLRKLASYEAGAYEEALRDAFLLMDVYLDSPRGREEVRNLRGGGTPDHTGTTAVVGLLRMSPRPELIVANAGDSRCVLISGKRALDISRDHGPRLPDERKRILRAGGWVTNEGRINGNLNLSRALGDLVYKRDRRLKPEEQLISGVPEIMRQALSARDSHLILACDGVWERMPSQVVADFVLARLRAPASPGALEPRSARLSEACAALLDECLSPNPLGTRGLGCDNMSVVLVSLSPGLTAPTEIGRGSLAAVAGGGGGSDARTMGHGIGGVPRARRPGGGGME